MSPPRSGRFQLVVQAVAKNDNDADTIHKMVKAIQKRALSDEEPDTLGVSETMLRREEICVADQLFLMMTSTESYDQPMIKRPFSSSVGNMPHNSKAFTSLTSFQSPSLFEHIVEEYEHADALLKTHMGGSAFKELLAKLGDLTETLNARFYQE